VRGPIRIGMLGDGAIAAEHAKVFAALGCEIRVIMAPDPASAENFARRHGVSRWTCDAAEATMAADVDAIVVATPNAEHASQTLAALAARKHVLCEIPLAMSLADARRISAAAEAAGLVCMVCHTQRFWSPVRRMADGVRQGEIRSCQVGIARGMNRRENIGWTGRKRAWVDDILWHHGAHAVDTAALLLGEEITTIVGHAGVRHPETGKPLDVALSLATASGRIGSILLSYNSLIPINDILLVAEEDAFQYSAGKLRDSAGRVLMQGAEAEMQWLAMQAQNRQFIDGIMQGSPIETGPARVLPVYATLQAAASHLGL
jgi:2-hydroxy-4-carboxymuconate semialdehyde hemiacetal dehydrogenase